MDTVTRRVTLNKPLLPCVQPEGEAWSVRVSCTNVAVEFCKRVQACPVCSMCAYDQRSNASWLSRCFDIWGNKLIWSLCILTSMLLKDCTHLHNYPLLQSEQIER